jgi:hypothetical protein
VRAPRVYAIRLRPLVCRAKALRYKAINQVTQIFPAPFVVVCE